MLTFDPQPALEQARAESSSQLLFGLRQCFDIRRYRLRRQLHTGVNARQLTARCHQEEFHHVDHSIVGLFVFYAVETHHLLDAILGRLQESILCQ
jgi:hypothetical protein